MKVQRFGSLELTKNNSYEQVYKEDDMYHYPRIEEKSLKRKEEYYFEEYEVTGSNNGNYKNQDFFVIVLKKIFFLH